MDQSFTIFIRQYTIKPFTSPYWLRKLVFCNNKLNYTILWVYRPPILSDKCSANNPSITSNDTHDWFAVLVIKWSHTRRTQIFKLILKEHRTLH